MVYMPHWPKLLTKNANEFKLDVMTEVLERAGNPHLLMPPTVYVSGTNGKGSVVAYLCAILKAAGYKVHAYTSPHLLHVNERIRVAGEMISDRDLYKAAEKARIAANDLRVSFFEGMTLTAFCAFAEKKADVAVVEVGMGGRLDATNVMSNVAVTIFTPISFDHTEYLGDTLELIAYEKSGIMRRGVPSVFAYQESEVNEALSRYAASYGSSVFRYGHEWSFSRHNDKIIYHAADSQTDLPLPALLGEHQIMNACTAVAASSILIDRYKFDIYHEDITEGMLNVKWPARLERIVNENIYRFTGLSYDWEIYLDGAHNADGARVLADWLRSGNNDRTFVIVGLTKGKNAQDFLKYFIGLTAKVVCICVRSETNAYKVDELCQVSRDIGLDAVGADSLSDALHYIAGRYEDKPGRIIVCGSLYLAGDFYKTACGLISRDI